jgi:DNA-binding MarR family transcriptional regulator
MASALGVRRDARVPMHIVFFALKRAHHGVLRITRRALAQLGLTASRFDLLYAVHEREGFPQFELCQALGVSAPTVSRMLSSLEELGLVLRNVGTDRRLRHISLTDAGRRCIEEAIRRFMHEGAAKLALDSALCPMRWYDEKVCSTIRQRLEMLLNKIRRASWDVADLYVPWDPDADDSPSWDQDPLLRVKRRL